MCLALTGPDGTYEILYYPSRDTYTFGASGEFKSPELADLAEQISRDHGVSVPTARIILLCANMMALDGRRG